MLSVHWHTAHAEHPLVSLIKKDNSHPTTPKDHWEKVEEKDRTINKYIFDKERRDEVK